MEELPFLPLSGSLRSAAAVEAQHWLPDILASQSLCVSAGGVCGRRSMSLCWNAG